MMETMEKELGKIEVTSGRLVVCDPCYLDDLGSRERGGTVVELPNGTYPVSVEVWEPEDRAMALVLGSYSPSRYREIGRVGVDSGQMAMLDATHLSVWAEPSTDDEEKTFDGPAGDAFSWVCEQHHAQGLLDYPAVCHLTLAGPGGVLAEKVAASGTGWGDGEYPVRATFNRDGEIVGLCVMFDEDADDGWDD